MFHVSLFWLEGKLQHFQSIADNIIKTDLRSYTVNYNSLNVIKIMEEFFKSSKTKAGFYLGDKIKLLEPDFTTERMSLPGCRTELFYCPTEERRNKSGKIDL